MAANLYTGFERGLLLIGDCFSVSTVVKLTSRYDYLITAGINFVFFQRAGRRPANILATQAVLPVVAGTPNLFGVVAVLDNALEVSADS